MNRSISALVFDFDGLILDTETPLKRSWQVIYEQHGLRVPSDQWAGLLGASADPPEAYDLLEQHLGQAVDRSAIRSARFKQEMELLANEDVLPGVLELIAEAKARDMRLAVASSSDRAWVTGHLSDLGLQQEFKVIVCADDVEHTKPSPDLYLAALRGLNVSPNQAIAFEDSIHGALAAKRAGLFCVVVPNRVTRYLVNPHADLIVESLADCVLDDLTAMAVKD